ncbi:MAG: hypothetical protein H6722_05030 [Sandaracinus sp.]|nr:hypothetical protein [Myxococcales bacterium]MCB9611802.1 hypothetical protein [Sandaracinus sp.]
MRRLSLLLVVACGPAPSVMDYHRSALDEIAPEAIGCTAYEVEDTSTEDLVTVGGDPDTRRYVVRGCGREEAFLCYTMNRMDASESPTCRPLRRGARGAATGGVHVGPFRVAD